MPPSSVKQKTRLCKQIVLSLHLALEKKLNSENYFKLSKTTSDVRNEVMPADVSTRRLKSSILAKTHDLNILIDWDTSSWQWKIKRCLHPQLFWKQIPNSYILVKAKWKNFKTADKGMALFFFNVRYETSNTLLVLKTDFYLLRDITKHPQQAL